MFPHFPTRIFQAVLNNLLYHLNEPPDYDNHETDYSLPAPEDEVWVCWEAGRAVGFGCIKVRGSPVPGGFMEQYQMDILDSVFVR